MCRCWLSHCAAKPPRQRTLQQALLCEPGADSDISSPAHSEQAIRNARCFSALLLPRIERKISRTMAMLGRLGGSQKKPPGTWVIPISKYFCSDKQKQFSAFQMFLQRGKILLLLFHAFKDTSFLDGAVYQNSAVYIFFWTLQYFLITQLLKSHSALCDDSRTLIHVLKQYFHLLWKRNSLDLFRTSVFPAVR